MNPRMETRQQRLPRKVWVRMLTGGIQRNVEISNHEDHKRIGKMTDGKFSGPSAEYIYFKSSQFYPPVCTKSFRLNITSMGTCRPGLRMLDMGVNKVRSSFQVKGGRMRCSGDQSNYDGGPD